MQARGSRAIAHSCPRNRGFSKGACEYRCCACLTPSQQTEAGVHSGVCASAKVKRWQGEATFVQCKHDPASMKLCHVTCVCVCACVCTRVCVCMCVCARVPRGIKLVSAGRFQALVTQMTAFSWQQFAHGHSHRGAHQGEDKGQRRTQTVVGPHHGKPALKRFSLGVMSTKVSRRHKAPSEPPSWGPWTPGRLHLPPPCALHDH